MGSITIRGVDPALKEKLRARAVQQGHSMEAEARCILEQALGPEALTGHDLYQRIRARFEPLGGVDLEIPHREPGREPPHFE